MLISKSFVGCVVFENSVAVFQDKPGHYVDAPFKSNLIFIISTRVLHCGYLIPAMHKRFFVDRCRQRTNFDTADKMLKKLTSFSI